MELSGSEQGVTSLSPSAFPMVPCSFLSAGQEKYQQKTLGHGNPRENEALVRMRVASDVGKGPPTPLRNIQRSGETCRQLYPSPLGPPLIAKQP